MMEHYILDSQKQAHPATFEEYAAWLNGNSDCRRVALTKVGAAAVSTVFLGLDHSWDGGAPLIFETMVFGGPLDQEMTRYSTWDEAQRGHEAMVERVKQ